MKNNIGANIDAVETSARYGISRDRAVNYHVDREGTTPRWQRPSVICAQIPPLGTSWSEEIAADFRARPKK